jgi:hypothetical protein
MAVTDSDKFWARHRPLNAVDVANVAERAALRAKYHVGIDQFLDRLRLREIERRGPPDPDSPEGMYLTIEAERAA